MSIARATFLGLRPGIDCIVVNYGEVYPVTANLPASVYSRSPEHREITVLSPQGEEIILGWPRPSRWIITDRRHKSIAFNARPTYSDQLQRVRDRHKARELSARYGRVGKDINWGWSMLSRGLLREEWAQVPVPEKIEETVALMLERHAEQGQVLAELAEYCRAKVARLTTE